VSSGPLNWIPRSPHDRLRAPRHLKDYQRSWFEELCWASLDQTEMQGYLPMTADLWRLAGAHCRDFWDKQKSAVLACFECATVVGQEVIFYPPLIEIINLQRKKIGNRKRRVSDEEISSISIGIHRGGGSPLSLSSQSVFDFDLKKKPLNENYARAGYSQDDFDQRDLRRMREAYRELRLEASGKVGGKQLSPKECFEEVCFRSGITVARGLELEAKQVKWPENAPAWAKEA
jgi:hypothetical protein